MNYSHKTIQDIVNALKKEGTVNNISVKNNISAPTVWRWCKKLMTEKQYETLKTRAKTNHKQAYPKSVRNKIVNALKKEGTVNAASVKHNIAAPTIWRWCQFDLTHEQLHALKNRSNRGKISTGKTIISEAKKSGVAVIKISKKNLTHEVLNAPKGKTPIVIWED